MLSSPFAIIGGPGSVPSSRDWSPRATPPPPPSMPVSSLLVLPPELIELVALEVDSLDDLRSLAATCRAVYTLIQPHHIAWHRVGCGLDEATVWRHLVEHPRVARAVRHLVLDSRMPADLPSGMHDATLPRSSSKDPSIERTNEELLMAAIANMCNLRKLVYRLRPPLSSDRFWQHLWRSCPRIEDVECADSSTARGHGWRESIHGSSFFEVRGLKRLVWCSSYVPSDPASIIAELGALETSLVEHCPDLEELLIQYTDVRVRNAIYGGTLMAHAQWPKLRVLELSRFHAGDEEAVAAFFDRHPQIEVLKLDQVDSTSGRYVYLDALSDRALGRLHTFWGGIDNAISVLASKSRPIRRLRGVQFDTVMLGARTPPNWTSTPQGQCLLEGLAQAEELEELDGEFAVVVSDKLDLVRLFEACKRVRVLKLRCNVAGFLESYLPAFESLQHLETLQFPLHQLDILHRLPASSGSMSLRYNGSSSDTFVTQLKHKARLVASVCTKLRKIDFGASGGTARIVRYDGSEEVSEVLLADAEGGDEESREQDVERTRAAAATHYAG